MKAINVDLKIENQKIKTEAAVPTNTSELNNDSGFVTGAVSKNAEANTIAQRDVNGSLVANEFVTGNTMLGDGDLYMEAEGMGYTDIEPNMLTLSDGAHDTTLTGENGDLFVNGNKITPTMIIVEEGD